MRQIMKMFFKDAIKKIKCLSEIKGIVFLLKGILFCVSFRVGNHVSIERIVHEIQTFNLFISNIFFLVIASLIR